MFGGRSYITMLMSPTPVQRREIAHVWVMDLRGFERQVTPGDSRLSRTEPEPLSSDGSMYIYFSARALDGSGRGTGNKMVYRSGAGPS